MKGTVQVAQQAPTETMPSQREIFWRTSLTDGTELMNLDLAIVAADGDADAFHEQEAAVSFERAQLDALGLRRPVGGQHQDGQVGALGADGLEQVVRATGRVVDMAVKRMPRRKDR